MVKLFVGNLNYSTTAEDLRLHFSDYEPGVVSKSLERRYGFVSIKDPKEGREAVENMNGTLLDDRPIVVQCAHPRDRDQRRRKSSAAQREEGQAQGLMDSMIWPKRDEEEARTKEVKSGGLTGTPSVLQPSVGIPSATQARHSVADDKPGLHANPTDTHNKTKPSPVPQSNIAIASSSKPHPFLGSTSVSTSSPLFTSTQSFEEPGNNNNPHPADEFEPAGSARYRPYILKTFIDPVTKKKVERFVPAED